VGEERGRGRFCHEKVGRIAGGAGTALVLGDFDLIGKGRERDRERDYIEFRTPS